MSYAVKEIFYTVQGEGVQSGRAAVFCRFAGCNLWSGHEKDRSSAICKFCDTDFIGTGPDGGRFDTESALADRIEQTWQSVSASGKKFVVFTGGEPLLQLDRPLIDAAAWSKLRDCGGNKRNTLPRQLGLDWICVSPKAGAKLVQTTGDELKLVFPQAGAKPGTFQGLSFRHFFLQPMDGPDRKGTRMRPFATASAIRPGD